MELQYRGSEKAYLYEKEYPIDLIIMKSKVLHVPLELPYLCGVGGISYEQRRYKKGMVGLV